MAKLDLYIDLQSAISEEMKRERDLANGRLKGVFFWCFIIPAALSFLLILAVKQGWAPRVAMTYVGWMLVVFPVVYSLWFLLRELFAPAAAQERRASSGASSRHFIREAEWRSRFCEQLLKKVTATGDEWRFLAESFRIDLDALRMRNHYLTGLAGAVFFLIMQGLDAVVDDVDSGGWDPYQFMGLALFLFLVALSHYQTQQSLRRFLGCLELLALDSKPE